ncbi:hypothetical protein SAMN04488095_2043 [Jannaschia pohangensis]|uniref:Uncharacterized protein n=1 Tax=Jannaschia pohangensis TaxID=390807 RepID=A0A1I3N4M7_9RHOB|nr:hypothetical protein SAMN04488095_2043 [Jannaschia pohangensis]
MRGNEALPEATRQLLATITLHSRVSIYVARIAEAWPNPNTWSQTKTPGRISATGG